MACLLITSETVLWETSNFMLFYYWNNSEGIYEERAREIKFVSDCLIATCNYH